MRHRCDHLICGISVICDLTSVLSNSIKHLNYTLFTNHFTSQTRINDQSDCIVALDQYRLSGH